MVGLAIPVFDYRQWADRFPLRLGDRKVAKPQEALSWDLLAGKSWLTGYFQVSGLLYRQLEFCRWAAGGTAQYLADRIDSAGGNQLLYFPVDELHDRHLS